MAIYGVSNPLTAGLANVGRPPASGGAGGAAGAGGVRPGQPGQPGGVRPGAVPARTPAAPAPAALRPQQPLAGAAQALPGEAPAGTDPALWSVLTGEERAYFAKAAASGPLTYGRIAAGVSALQGGPAAPATPAMRGARLDVRA